MRSLVQIKVPSTFAAALLASVLSGCAVHGGVTVDPIPPVYLDTRGGYPGPRGVYPSSRVKIPPGHMPPPGSCRIWFPDRPPGQQPPPGDCYELQHRIPPGAVFVRG